MIIKSPTRPGAATQVLPLRAFTIAVLLTTFLLPARLLSQTEPSALFEVQSTDKGFLMPRLTKAQRESIVNPATGLMIYNLTSDCLEMNIGSPAAPDWVRFITQGKVGSLDCTGVGINGQLVQGQQVINMSASIPYTGGNGGFHTGQTASSTGVSGLNALVAGGNFSLGAGTLTYTITGIPASAGTASFVLKAGGKSCILDLNVASGSIGPLNCNNAIINGMLVPGQPTSGVLASIPYVGSGGPHNGQTVASTGVSGLMATLPPGTFVYGAGTLDYFISGTPSGAGTASFALNIGGASCNLDLAVSCGAYVAPNDWKTFLCHNLGAANTAADPFQPSWEIVGGYWQWGWKGPDPSTWLNTNTENFAHGPTGPGAAETNEAAINDWSQTYAPNGAWSDVTKTFDDPCPAGFRLPTNAQWEGVRNNNSQVAVGTWYSSSTNYSSGRLFGSALLLPASGYRFYNDGAQAVRGDYGGCWSSTEFGSDNAWSLLFYNGDAFTANDTRSHGLSLRCVAE